LVTLQNDHTFWIVLCFPQRGKRNILLSSSFGLQLAKARFVLRQIPSLRDLFFHVICHGTAQFIFPEFIFPEFVSPSQSPFFRSVQGGGAAPLSSCSHLAISKEHS